MRQHASIESLVAGVVTASWFIKKCVPGYEYKYKDSILISGFSGAMIIKTFKGLILRKVKKLRNEAGTFHLQHRRGC